MNHTPCSHKWIDPNDPPIERATYAPMIGPLRRQMKPGGTYQCLNCKQILHIVVQPVRDAEKVHR